jgi:hypothetical protein
MTLVYRFVHSILYLDSTDLVKTQEIFDLYRLFSEQRFVRVMVRDNIS